MLFSFCHQHSIFVTHNSKWFIIDFIILLDENTDFSEEMQIFWLLLTNLSTNQVAKYGID
jgi:hypothetical protein